MDKGEKEVVLDTETTGLNPYNGDRIVEIGALELINNELTGRKFHYYINPEREMPEEAYRIHGISTEFLKDKPLFKDIVQEFLEFIEDAKLVIHNASFDIKFLNAELERENLPTLNLAEAVDTLKIARKKYPGTRVNLDALCKKFNIDNSSRQYHGALLDSELLVDVYIELTGGRQSSFLMSKKEENTIIPELSTIKTKGNGIIVTPSEDEQNKHTEFLKKIMSAN